MKYHIYTLHYKLYILYVFYIVYSIEDPFEISYDVAHVMRSSKKDQGIFRKEMLRAYTLIRRTNNINITTNDNDNNHIECIENIPKVISPDKLLSILFEENMDMDTDMDVEIDTEDNINNDEMNINNEDNINEELVKNKISVNDNNNIN